MNTLSFKKQSQLIDELKQISPESQNQNTLNVDLLNAKQILEKINNESQN